MRVSIRSKLIVAILLPILAVYLTVLAINYSSHTREARAQTEQHLTELASHHATRLDSRFLAAEQAARSMASLIVAREPLLSLQQGGQHLWQRVLGNPALYGALIALEPGVVGTRPETGVSALKTAPARPERFEMIVAQNPAASPEEITTLVVQTVEQYRTHPQQDDVTLLALRRNS